MSDKSLIIIFFVLSISTSILIGSSCSDGFASSSIGSRGACSHHGGVSQMNILIGLFVGVLGVAIIGSIANAFFPPTPLPPLNPQNFTSTKTRPRRRSRYKRTNKNLKYSYSQPKKNKQIIKTNHKQTANTVTSKKTILDTSTQSNPNIPNCPKCGMKMAFRDSKNYGTNFWGCSTYPKCKGILPYEKKNNYRKPTPTYK